MCVREAIAGRPKIEFAFGGARWHVREGNRLMDGPCNFF